MIEKIGEAAGAVWKTLDANGPLSMSELTRKTRLPSALLQRAVGWLARENKVRLTQDKQKEIVALRR